MLEYLEVLHPFHLLIMNIFPNQQSIDNATFYRDCKIWKTIVQTGQTIVKFENSKTDFEI